MRNVPIVLSLLAFTSTLALADTPEGPHDAWKGPIARMVRPANPDTYYPKNGEEGRPVVLVCVDQHGKLLREPVVTDSSGFPDLDAAAIKVARASGYAAALVDGKPAAESCIKYRINFRPWQH